MYSAVSGMLAQIFVDSFDGSEESAIPAILSVRLNLRNDPGHAVCDSGLPIILRRHDFVADCELLALAATVNDESWMHTRMD
jgi:hypothetical protein